LFSFVTDITMNMENHPAAAAAAAEMPWFVAGQEVAPDPVVMPHAVASVVDEVLDADAAALYKERWSSIRTHVRESRRGSVSYYILRVPLDVQDQSMVNDFMEAVLRRQATAFRVNASCGLILRRQDGNVRYFHSSMNNYRVADQPVVVTSADDLRTFVADYMDLYVMGQQNVVDVSPSSAWSLVALTNVSVQVYHTDEMLIGGPGDEDDDDDEDEWIRTGVRSVRYVPRHTDNLCFFRCLAIHKNDGLSAKELFRRWTERRTGRPTTSWGRRTTEEEFKGVSLKDMHELEACFDVRIWIYQVDRAGAKRRRVVRQIRRSAAAGATSELRLLLTKDGKHVHLVLDLMKLGNGHLCQKCGVPWQYPTKMRRHEATCGRGGKVIYKEGPYFVQRNVFEALGDIGVEVPDWLRCHKYRATFDYEAYQTDRREAGVKVPAGYVTKHVPMSCSVASNVPGFDEGPVCFVSRGDPGEVVERMVSFLRGASRKAYELYRETFAGVLLAIEGQLKRLVDTQSTREDAANADEETSEAERAICHCNKEEDLDDDDDDDEEEAERLCSGANKSGSKRRKRIDPVQRLPFSDCGTCKSAWTRGWLSCQWWASTVPNMTFRSLSLT
jgi:hypothetical protein